MDADFVCIGSSDIGVATHRVISHEGATFPDVWAILQRKIALVTKALARSEQSKRDQEVREGYPYSDLGKLLVLNSALGVLVPVWSCSALVDVLVTPTQQGHFSGRQREILNLLITHIGEAFRRVWTASALRD